VARILKAVSRKLDAMESQIVATIYIFTDAFSPLDGLA
jgi:hypothetical protein